MNANQVKAKVKKVYNKVTRVVNDGGGFFSVYIEKPSSIQEFNAFNKAMKSLESFDACRGFKGNTETEYWKQYRVYE